MTDLWGYLCVGVLCLLPPSMFVLGFLIGRDRLPFRVTVERNRAAYEVDDGTPVNWQ